MGEMSTGKHPSGPLAQASTTSLHRLRERRDDFKEAARRLRAVYCVIEVESDESGPCPLFRDHPLGDGRSMAVAGRYLKRLAGASRRSGWMVAREKGLCSGDGPPPMRVEGTRKVYDPTSTWTKPWGFFWADNCDHEAFTLHFAGDDDAFHEYKKFAGMLARDLTSTSLPEPLRTMISNAVRLVSYTDDYILWTLLLFDLVWRGVAPPSLTAPRTTWAGDFSLPLDDGTPELILRGMAAPDGSECHALKAAQIPARWHHFGAELSPDLLSASAELLSHLIRGIENDQPPPPPPKRSRRDISKDNRVVSNYIRTQREKGVPIAQITRDSIAEATGVPGGSVSETNAWRGLAEEKSCQKARGGGPIDDAIDRGDWDAVERQQAREQNRPGPYD